MNQRPFIPAWIFEQGFNAHQLAIFCYVTMRGRCFESKKSMIRALNMSPNAFWDNLNVLINDGWIVKKSNGKGRAVTLTCQQPETRANETKRDREAKVTNLMDHMQNQMKAHGLQDEPIAQNDR